MTYLNCLSPSCDSKCLFKWTFLTNDFWHPSWGHTQGRWEQTHTEFLSLGLSVMLKWYLNMQFTTLEETMSIFSSAKKQIFPLPLSPDKKTMLDCSQSWIFLCGFPNQSLNPVAAILIQYCKQNMQRVKIACGDGARGGDSRSQAMGMIKGLVWFQIFDSRIFFYRKIWQEYFGMARFK